MFKPTGALWQNKDFLKIWAGESISLIGSQVTLFALPLLAVLTFHADPFQVGLLGTAGYLPYLLVSLFAGVWIDRWHRRPVLVSANLVNALVLGSIPLAAFFNLLTIEQLYLVSFLSGTATVFFQVAYVAYLPSLVKPAHLAEANGKLELSYSVAVVSGPGLAGVLVQVISVTSTIFLDVFSFLVSTFNLLRIKTREEPVKSQRQSGNIWQEIWVGLSLIIRHPLLRALSGSTGMTVFFRVAINTQLTLYAVQELGIEPGVLGAILALGSFGPLVGALVASRLNKWWGVGTGLIWIKLAGDAAYLLIPLAFGPPWLIVIILAFSEFLSNFVVPIYNINVVTIQQTLVPDNLKGRVSASNRFLSWSTIPLGTMLSGIIGGIVGIRLTLLLFAIGVSFSFLWLYLSPMRTLKNFDALPPLEEGPRPILPVVEE